MLKKAVSENFEGYTQRAFFSGELFKDGLLERTSRGVNEERMAAIKKYYIGSEVCVLSGPAKGQWRKLASFEARKVTVTDKKGNKKELETIFMFFDKPINLDESLRAGEVNPYADIGLLQQKTDTSHGTLGTVTNGKTLPEDAYELKHDDIRPGSTGKTTLLLKAAIDKNKKPIAIKFDNRMPETRGTDCNRVYKLSFWAKAGENGAKIVATVSGKQDIASETTVLSSKWKHYELMFDATGKFPPTKLDAIPWKSPRVKLRVHAEVGAILIDDIEFEGLGYKNPTPWVDEAVEALKFADLGVLRRIGMFRPGLDILLQPVLDQPAYTKFVPADPTKKRMSVQRITPADYFPLCAYLKVDAWFCLPQVTSMDDMDMFMEYIGAPADVGYGKVRAAEGHPKPWLETIPRIQVEFGNEVWNFGGYDRQDYWNSLIARAKKSKYYKPNMVFHTAGMHYSFGRNKPTFDNTPTADRFSIAPYIVHRYPKVMWDLSPEDRARYVINYGLRQNIFGENANKQYDYGRSKGIEHSVYEVNHHIIAIEGDGKGEFAATKDPKKAKLINEYVVSKIAGINVINNMLMMLKQAGIRDQCFFTFSGQFYQIKLWGGVLQCSTKKPVYRPHWLALATANKGIFGDLIVTSHSGSKPQFTAPDIGKKRKGTTGPPVNDCLWSYSFKDGNKRSVIVANLDVTKSLPVKINFTGTPKGKVVSWQVVGGTHLSNNEPEINEPQVFLKESEIKDFKSGYCLTLPAASIITIVWNE